MADHRCRDDINGKEHQEQDEVGASSHEEHAAVVFGDIDWSGNAPLLHGTAYVTPRLYHSRGWSGLENVARRNTVLGGRYWNWSEVHARLRQLALALPIEELRVRCGDACYVNHL